MDRYFNRATSLRGFSEIAAQRSVDLVAAMTHVGLDPSLLKRPDDRVSFDQLCALYEHCAAAWGLPDLGLRLSTYQPIDILGPVSLLTRIEPDLRSALKSMAANLLVHSNATIASLSETGNVAILSLDAQPVPAGTRQYLLASVGVAWNVVQQAANTEVELFEVTFRARDQGAHSAAVAHFHCPVRFNAESNAIYFDRKALDRRNERTDTAYHAIIQRYLSTSRDEIAGRARDAVAAEIARQMEFGVCTLESVAQNLRLEPRSLQRRLRHEDVTFKDLMDDWRRARALSLVTNSRMPLAEVSLAIGYNDQSIFSRAFQRWFGDTPLNYRNRDAAIAAASRKMSPDA